MASRVYRSRLPNKAPARYANTRRPRHTGVLYCLKLILAACRLKLRRLSRIPRRQQQSARRVGCRSRCSTGIRQVPFGRPGRKSRLRCCTVSSRAPAVRRPNMKRARVGIFRAICSRGIKFEVVRWYSLSRELYWCYRRAGCSEWSGYFARIEDLITSARWAAGA